MNQAEAMAQVCLDLHKALGVPWGENPYAAIEALRKDSVRLDRLISDGQVSAMHMGAVLYNPPVLVMPQSYRPSTAEAWKTMVRQAIDDEIASDHGG